MVAYDASPTAPRISELSEIRFLATRKRDDTKPCQSVVP
jgi:hypothetical protein